jgi:Flp pilus assembly protein TadD
MKDRSIRNAGLALFALTAAAGTTGCVTPRVLHDRAIAHNGTGVDRLAEGDLAGAEVAFRLALEYDPRFSEPYANLAVVALERGDLADAEALLNRALRLNPDFAAAWANLGVLRLRRGDPTGAEEAFREALAADPDHHAARYDLVLVAVELGDLDLAAEQAGRLGVASPDDPAVLGLQALVAAERGDPAGALRLATRAVDLDPTQPVALYAAGRALAAQGRHDDAVVVFDLALARGESLGPLLGAAESLIRTGRYAEAYGRLVRAVRFDGAGPATWAAFGGLALYCGHDDAAAAAVAHLRRFAPDDPAVDALAAGLAEPRGDAGRPCDRPYETDPETGVHPEPPRITDRVPSGRDPATAD